VIQEDLETLAFRIGRDLAYVSFNRKLGPIVQKYWKEFCAIMNIAKKTINIAATQ